MLGDDSPDIHGTNSFMWYSSHERYTVSNVEARFLHFSILPGIEPLHHQAYVLDHSATALLLFIYIHNCMSALYYSMVILIL